MALRTSPPSTRCRHKHRQSFLTSLCVEYRDGQAWLQAAVGPPSEICTDLPAGHKEATAALRLDVNRGYGWPGLHVASESCRNLSTRIPMETLVPQDSNVGAIRIAASGWEGWLLKSLGVSPPVPGSVGTPKVANCTCKPTEAAASVSSETHECPAGGHEEVPDQHRHD